MKTNEEQSSPDNGAGLPLLSNIRSRPYCKRDLLKLYGVGYKALSVWLKPMAAEIGPLHGRFFTTAQLKIIFATLGYPGEDLNRIVSNNSSAI